MLKWAQKNEKKRKGQYFVLKSDNQGKHKFRLCQINCNTKQAIAFLVWTSFFLIRSVNQAKQFLMEAFSWDFFSNWSVWRLRQFWDILWEGWRHPNRHAVWPKKWNKSHHSVLQVTHVKGYSRVRGTGNRIICSKICFILSSI